MSLTCAPLVYVRTVKVLETQGEWLTILNAKNLEGFIPTSFVAIINENNKIYGHFTYSAEGPDQLGPCT